MKTVTSCRLGRYTPRQSIGPRSAALGFTLAILSFAFLSGCGGKSSDKPSANEASPVAEDSDPLSAGWDGGKWSFETESKADSPARPASSRMHAHGDKDKAAAARSRSGIL